MCSVLLAAGKLVRSDLKYHLVPQMSGLRSHGLFPGSGSKGPLVQRARQAQPAIQQTCCQALDAVLQLRFAQPCDFLLARCKHALHA